MNICIVFNEVFEVTKERYEVSSHEIICKILFEI